MPYVWDYCDDCGHFERVAWDSWFMSYLCDYCWEYLEYLEEKHYYEGLYKLPYYW